MLPYVHRVTEYDPADRDEDGGYVGDQEPVSDHGPVENAYLRAVAAFAADAGAHQLTIREPECAGIVHFGPEPAVVGHGLAGLFPPDLAQGRRQCGGATCKGRVKIPASPARGS